MCCVFFLFIFFNLFNFFFFFFFFLGVWGVFFGSVCLFVCLFVHSFWAFSFFSLVWYFFSVVYLPTDYFNIIRVNGDELAFCFKREIKQTRKMLLYI